MSDRQSLEEQVERYLEANPDASVPEVAGALGESPAAIAEVVTDETPEPAEDSNNRARDHLRRSRTRSRTDLRTRFSKWADADFANPESNSWPDELLEREQWMGHVDKKPFAPWADRDHPEADVDEDARWKWGLEENYGDGETIAMAEIDPRLDGRAFLQTESDPYVYVDGDDVRCPETGDVHPAFVA
ncbi:hypothetical protein QNM96_00005, partial [Halostagnicola sp. A-GB9-2]|nr:hypothetical protein [Halostagnicola sp. A-GB9-2]